MKTAHSIQDYMEVIRKGVRWQFKEGRPKDILIVGAGMAGLTAGYELKRAGHRPIILEAQHCVGGRVHTLRRRAGFILLENTHRSSMPGFRARSSLDCAKRSRSIKRRNRNDTDEMIRAQLTPCP